MKKNKIIVCIIILFTISFLSIGFSAFNASIFVEDIGATVRLNSDIRITDIIISDASEEVIANYSDYDVGSIFSEIYLPNDDSSITYKVSITNFELAEMGIFDITGLPDNLEYSISDYVLKDKICNEDGKCNLGITKDIYITIKYKNNIKDSDNNLYKIKLLFDFRNYYTINYENVYGFDFPTEVIHGDSLVLNLEYDNISLLITNKTGYKYINGTDYIYENGIVMISSVYEDLYITTNDEISITGFTENDSEGRIIKYFGNVLNSKIILSDDVTSYKSFNITIHNFTEYDQIFTGVTIDNNKYDNNNITFSLSGLSVNDVLKADTNLQFSIVFKYIDGIDSNLENINNILNSFLKFNFTTKYFAWDEYVYNGFDLLNIIETSSDTLKMQISPMSKAYDRLVIPVKNLDVGSYYTITFNEKKTLLSGKTYINDSSLFAYGTAVTIKSIDDKIGTNEESFILPKYFNYDNNPLHTAFMWKEPFLEIGYIEGKMYNISLTFYASEETMYWMWDFANIRNSAEIEFALSDIKIRKIEYPKSSPYIRFVDTTFSDWTYDTDYDDDGTNDKQNYLQYTYRTTATENELDLRIETGKGWEYFNIPIKNLSIGSTYKLTYNLNTTPTALGINTSNIYASIVQNQPFLLDQRLISSSDSNKKNISFINKVGSYSGTIEFTATDETMYWVWQCGGLKNYQWANIKIDNVTLETIS